MSTSEQRQKGVTALAEKRTSSEDMRNDKQQVEVEEGGGGGGGGDGEGTKVLDEEDEQVRMKRLEAQLKEDVPSSTPLPPPLNMPIVTHGKSTGAGVHTTHVATYVCN